MTPRIRSALAFAAVACVALGGVPAAATAMPDHVVRSVDHQWPVDEKGDGCAPPVWPSAKKSQDFRRVLVVGDSLIRNSRAQLESKLTEAGWLPTVRCWGAMGGSWGVEQIHRARDLGQLPDSIVVSLGTNDIWWLHVPLESTIDSMMAAIGPKRSVYWVNLWFGPSGYDDLPKPFAANRLLHDKVKEYPNLRIINFAEAFKAAEASGKPVGWEDGVHLNAAGNRLRVKAIVDALGAPIAPMKS